MIRLIFGAVQPIPYTQKDKEKVALVLFEDSRSASIALFQFSILFLFGIHCDYSLRIQPIISNGSVSLN